MTDEIKVLFFLENCIDDPMWPSHFEMHKDKAQTIISIIQKLRAQNYALQDEKEKLRADVIEECAVAAEQQDRVGYEWVRDSLWAKILRRAGDNVRSLKRGISSSSKEAS